MTTEFDPTTSSALAAARIQYQQDYLFRRYVEVAAHEALQHMSHVENDIDRRDLHHVAITAAMTAMRLTIEGDRMLSDMEAQRNHYKKVVEESFRTSPAAVLVPSDWSVIP